jgi:hypothetical protein
LQEFDSGALTRRHGTFKSPSGSDWANFFDGIESKRLFQRKKIFRAATDCSDSRLRSSASRTAHARQSHPGPHCDKPI